MNQAAKKLMMIRPQHFGFDPASAASNAFQHNEGADDVKEITADAISEFDTAVEKLRAQGLDIVVIQDTDKPHKPNAVFPNNWISFHDDCVLLYPMMAENRRWERREEIINEVLGDDSKPIIDLTDFENEGKLRLGDQLRWRGGPLFHLQPRRAHDHGGVGAHPSALAHTRTSRYR